MSQIASFYLIKITNGRSYLMATALRMYIWLLGTTARANWI